MPVARTLAIGEKPFVGMKARGRKAFRPGCAKVTQFPSAQGAGDRSGHLAGMVLSAPTRCMKP